MPAIVNDDQIDPAGTSEISPDVVLASRVDKTRVPSLEIAERPQPTAVKPHPQAGAYVARSHTRPGVSHTPAPQITASHVPPPVLTAAPTIAPPLTAVPAIAPPTAPAQTPVLQSPAPHIAPPPSPVAKAPAPQSPAPHVAQPQSPVLQSPAPHVAAQHVAPIDPPKRALHESRSAAHGPSVFGRLMRRTAIAALLVLCIAGAAFAWRSHSNNVGNMMRSWLHGTPGSEAPPPRIAATEPASEPATAVDSSESPAPTMPPSSSPPMLSPPTIIVAAPSSPSPAPIPPTTPILVTSSSPQPILTSPVPGITAPVPGMTAPVPSITAPIPAISAPTPVVAGPAAPTTPAEMTQTLSAMTRELAALQQKIDELRSGLAELKSGQEQLTHEVTKITGTRLPDARPVEAHAKPGTTTHPGANPQRRSRPVTAAPLRPAPYYPPTLPQAATTPPAQTTTAPQLLTPGLQQPLASEDTPRPPMPMR